MIKNPLINGVLAILYIVALVLLTHYVFSAMPQTDSIFAPMAMISLFTLSAGVMGYLFLSRPIQLYLDGQKKEAVTFFLTTLTTFAVLTITLFLVVLSGIF